MIAFLCLSGVLQVHQRVKREEKGERGEEGRGRGEEGSEGREEEVNEGRGRAAKILSFGKMTSS